MEVKLLLCFLLYHATHVMTDDFYIYMELCDAESCYKVDINVTARSSGTGTMVRTTCSTPTAIDPRERMRELMVIQTVNSSQEHQFCNKTINDEKRIDPNGFVGISFTPAAYIDETGPIHGKLRLRVNFTEEKRFSTPVRPLMLNLSSSFVNCTSLQEHDNKVCACDQAGEAERYCNNITNAEFLKGNTSKVYHVYGQVASPGYAPHKYYLRITIQNIHMGKIDCSYQLRVLGLDLFKPQQSGTELIWRKIANAYESDCIDSGGNVYGFPAGGTFVIFAKSLHTDEILELVFFEIELWFDQFVLGECRAIQLTPFAKYCYCMLGNRTEDFCGSIPLLEFSWVPVKSRLALEFPVTYGYTDPESSSLTTLNSRIKIPDTSIPNNIAIANTTTSTSHLEELINDVEDIARKETLTEDASFVLIQYGFRNRKLFPTNESKECELGYYFAPYNDHMVLSAKLLDISSLSEIHQLDTKLSIVRLRFGIKNHRTPLHGSTKLAYWYNHNWVTTHADIQISGDNLVAEVSHLTDFTLLVDGLKSDPLLCDPFLNKFSKLLNTISLNSLLFLIFFTLMRSCWIRPDYTLPAVVLPLSGLIFHGLICFVCILAKVQLQGITELFRILSNRRIRRIVTGIRGHKSTASMMDRIMALFCIQIMLGLPWVFQYLAASSPRLVISHYIFTIAVGSQGILLFLFFLYRHCRTRQRRKPFKHSVVFTNLHDPIRCGR
ncbi:MeTHuselah (aging-associated GPCR) like protein [Ditylenchus destructor]|nr:MeTHuselah (aging-associated GPCR) like protein [Ditylenchus destructor]